MATRNLTYTTFCNEIADLEKYPVDWKYKGKRPALIDFYASWCGPCKMLAPLLEELSEEYAGKVDIYKVDVDKEEHLARIFDIRSIPTLIAVPMVGKPERSLGARSKEQLRELLNGLM